MVYRVVRMLQNVILLVPAVFSILLDSNNHCCTTVGPDHDSRPRHRESRIIDLRPRPRPSGQSQHATGRGPEREA